jgi:hypothetical protein
MKSRPTQFGVRENTASPRQHVPRLAINASVLQSDTFPAIERPDENTHESVPAIKETLELSVPDPGKGTSGGGESRPITSARPGDGKRLPVERPLTCEEAAAFVRVHPRTVKRMARAGKVPGHFRFGRWYFYASERDCWMRMELHSARHP